MTSLQYPSLSINPFIIKESFSSYSDSSAFSNYQKICKDYYKLHTKFQKKYANTPKDKLRNEVKHWFFNQSLENRIKLCTVENEFFCQIIYQMFLQTKADNTVKFYPKTELIDIYELSKKINLNNSEEKSDFDIEKYFQCKSEHYSSYVNKYNLYEGSIYYIEGEENDRKYNSSINEFINEIIFYSVHHRPYPDCFCLSPCFLMKEERFDTSFNFLGNIDYFNKLIEPLCCSDKNIYGYKLPSWISSPYSYSITQYIFAFIEQAIMVKFLLNNYSIYNNKKYNYGKNNKNNACIFSLINDEILNSIFIDRKTVINYLNINYNSIDSKKELINDANINNIFYKILKNNDIMHKITFFKNFSREKNYNGFAGSMLIQPLLGINTNNIVNTLYDNICNFIANNPEEQNNYLINKIKTYLDDIIENNDNIIIVDNLLFQNFKGLWDINYFINVELIEIIINLFNEKNYNDLLKEETPSKKKGRKKKKKKNQNNNNEIKDNDKNENNKIENNNQSNNKEDEKEKEKENLMYNIDLECYNEIFKDKEKLLYVPYYFKNDVELKAKFNKIKENKLKLIERNNKKKDIKEIINYIKNEFILKYLIDKVIHLQPDNYVSFFENNIDEKANNKDIIIKKIHGLKLRKNKSKNFLENDNFGTITINLNTKNSIIDNDTNNNNKGNKIENMSRNKDNKIRANSLDKKYKNNLEKEIKDLKEEKNNKINELKENIIDQNNDIKNNSNSSTKNSNSSKKREKSPNIFFLFDTIKNKNKKKTKSKSPNNIKSEKNNLELSFIPSNIKYIKPESGKDKHLFFIEKLHNIILKNEIKVNNILQFLSKFKNYCIEEIKKIIKNSYNNILLTYEIDLYGSFITGLMIEASDIDIRIKINEGSKNDLDKYFFILYDKLKGEQKFESITPISTASVPVIKLTLDIEKFINNEKELEKDFNKFKELDLFKNFIFDKKELTQIKIDITYIINHFQNTNKNSEMNNKMHNDKLNINNNFSDINDNEKLSLSYIKKSLEEYPEVKPILKLLKRYFYIKKMNSSFEGGLSSYNLFLLILSYAKYQQIYNLNPYKKINLGFFLIQFLEFFGKIFDFKNFLININSPYIYELNTFINYNSKSLVILDPITGANASKSSYKIEEIQKMFLNAYEFFEKERINYENEMNKREKNDKIDNDKKNNFEVILGLAKVNKHDYNKKNNKDNKLSSNIIDKFFFS